MDHAPTDRPRILVIEDDAATREVLQLLLEDVGCGLVFAATARAGLTAATEELVDLIILDRRLPDGDGLELSRRVRAERTAALPILLVTADHDPALDAAARAAGVTALLRKPFDPAALLDAIGSLSGPRAT
jgi:two-component system, chemotaxis family, chemotaxis protein CheY